MAPKDDSSYGMVTDECRNPLSIISGVEKTPVRISPKRGLEMSSSMTYRTHAESLAEPKSEEARSRRIIRNASSVKFDMVAVREYPVALGDNPSVSSGAPIAIGWDPVNHVEYKMDEYEKLKPLKRSHCELFLSFKVRQKILEDNGFTGKEIRQTLVAVNHAKTQRQKTVSGLMKGNDLRDESIEKIKDHTKRFFSRVSPMKRQQKKDKQLMQFI